MASQARSRENDGRREQRRTDAIERAIEIAQLIAQRDDLRVREQLTAFAGQADYSDRESLLIAEDAWRHVQQAGVEPRLVFAHPAILTAIPEASMHYRGIALLSRKRVAEIAGNVERWERQPARARVAPETAMRVCQLYNAVICSIILNNTAWTIENGYRNILATMGITADGAMRNIIGQAAETAVKKRMFRWVQTRGLVATDITPARENEWALATGVVMRYGSEPDISFEKDGALAVLIEVKGGKDPAGALERLGAMQKTFEEAPAQCKNFLIAGVVTPTMRDRLSELRVERVFNMDILHDDAKWTEFMNEIFHHALRIAPEAPTPPAAGRSQPS